MSVNDALERRSLSVMPGPQSNLRVPIAAHPTFIVRGEGARLWDEDGREYIDYMIAAGAGILGHGHPEYIQTLKNQLDTLLYTVSGASQTRMEIELAEKFVQHVPCAEQVRLCVSGTEAVQLAIRLARAYTGRPYFIRFEGHYHGWLDNVLGGAVSDDPIDRPFPQEKEDDPLSTEGRDENAFSSCFRLPWNDIQILEAVLEKWGDKIAMIHMEPVLVNSGCCPPRPGYLARVRELCDHYGIVFCFDEIITGFRVGLGGAQAELGVTPDLATYGKALAAGMPISAVAGRADILDLLRNRRVVGAGTFNGYPLGVAAALATIKILEKDNGGFYRRLDTLQIKLVEGLKQIAARFDQPVLIQGLRGVLGLHFIDIDTAYSVHDLKGADTDMQNKLRMCLAHEGVLVMWGGRWYLSAALTGADIEETLHKANRAFARLKN